MAEQHPKPILSRLNLTRVVGQVPKAKLAEWLNAPASTRKATLVSDVIARISSSELALRWFFSDFRKETALSGPDIETLLGITKTERLRWTKDGRLPVSHLIEVSKYGKTLEVPQYDALGALKAHDKVAEWREEHAREARKARAGSAAKAAESRQRNRAMREKTREAIRQRVASWAATGDIRLARTMELAMWTMWANRWAKERSLLADRARKPERRYEHIHAEMELWKLKHQAVAILARSGFATLSAYVPENPHRFRFDLCPLHLDIFREERRGGLYRTANEFFFDNMDEIMDCHGCVVNVNEHYYSLYFLEVRADGIKDTFSFHVPYPIGNGFLPDFASLPQVHHEHDEAWEGFRFGRSLFDDEKILFPESDVRKRMCELMRLLDA